MDSNSSSKLPISFGGEPIEDWDQKWAPLKGGLYADHEVVRGEFGLFRLRRRNEIVYVGCSAAKSGPRLLSRLRVFAAPPQSGNNHFGARMIRQYGREVEVEVIKLGKDIRQAYFTVDLRDAMIGHYRPAGNARRPSARKGRK